ncbi:AraC family transcriptional regulator [Sulfurimonas sp.]|uniref:helix-turn-helix domain-containing protein n=1 Tax=Sulfurimonas sp. TaxID=2022749 RepID=UPI002B4925E0|nr:AraC family transcriptional regulator [Sulfurimonas sp.]
MSFNDKSFEFSNNQTDVMTFSNGKITGSIIEKKIIKGIFLVKADIAFKENIIVESNAKIDGIILDFNIKGNIKCKSKISDLKLTTSDNMTDIQLMKDGITESIAQKEKVNKISLVIKNDFLSQNIPNSKIKDKLLNSLQKDICHEVLSSKKTNYQTRLLLNQIFLSPFEGELNNIFIQSKVLEIVFLEFQELFENQNISKINTLKLDEYDINAIKQAKDILIQNMQNPPSIIELSRLVKLNDFKLKKGFKQLYGITPYNLLINYKLEYAKKLLTDGDMNINEISHHIGYKFTQSFSTAFSHKFGVLPKDLMKNRKYCF